MMNISSCLAIAPPQGLALVPLVTMIGIVIVGLANARQRRFFGKEYFLLTHVAMFLWLGAVTLELSTPVLACRPLFAGLAFVGISLLPVAWGLFIYHYAFSLDRRVGQRELAALIGVPLVVAGIALTNQWHGQFYMSIVEKVNAEGVSYIEYGHGPLFHAVTVGLYSLILATFALLVRGVLRAAPQYRLYFAYPAMMMAVVFVPNAAFLGFDVNFYGFDPTPFSFVFVVILFSLLIVSNRVFDVVNISSELIFAGLRSPAMIVDDAGRIISANPVAHAVFPQISAEPGLRVFDLEAMAPALRVFEGRFRVVPGRRIMVGDRFYDVDAIVVPKPLAKSGEPIGTVLLMNDVTAEEQRYRELEAELASNMRQLETSTAMQAALREAAEFDPLTRVRNRLSLPSLFVHCIDQAAKEQRKVVMALFDIDHFKRWNDLHGHSAGDRVLRDFARFLEEMTAPNSGCAGATVFRIGGEEFLLLCPDADTGQVAARVEAMQRVLSKADFQRSGDGAAMTFSAGVAQWPDDGATLEALLETADRRLYSAKSAGRNCVIAA
jgi:diguanylate cyclase (GGDEF)-like protein